MSLDSDTVVMQNTATQFITYMPLPASNDENTAAPPVDTSSTAKAGTAGACMLLEAAQLFHALWLSMREQNVLAVGMFKARAAFTPHPVALVVQEEQFGPTGEQVRNHA